MRRSRLVAVCATAVVGVVAAVGGIVANNVASADPFDSIELPGALEQEVADGVPDPYAVFGQRMPLVATAAGVEGRIAIGNSELANVSDDTAGSAYVDGVVTFTVSPTVVVHHRRPLHFFEPGDTSLPIPSDYTEPCQAVGTNQFTCPLHMGMDWRFGSAYDFTAQLPFGVKPVIRAVVSDIMVEPFTSPYPAVPVPGISRTLEFNFGTRSDQVVVV